MTQSQNDLIKDLQDFQAMQASWQARTLIQRAISEIKHLQGLVEGYKRLAQS